MRGQDGAQDLHSRHFCHVEIEHHQVEVPSRNQFERGVAIADRGYIVAFDLKKGHTPFAETAVIVYDENTDVRF